jgi:hypothetical protein
MLNAMIFVALIVIATGTLDYDPQAETEEA